MSIDVLNYYNNPELQTKDNTEILSKEKWTNIAFINPENLTYEMCLNFAKLSGKSIPHIPRKYYTVELFETALQDEFSVEIVLQYMPVEIRKQINVEEYIESYINKIDENTGDHCYSNGDGTFSAPFLRKEYEELKESKENCRKFLELHPAYVGFLPTSFLEENATL